MKKILTIGALVSLIPLASVSIVSCKKKKTETNNQEQQKPTPETPGSPSAPSTPEIEKPSVDQNNPSEKPSTPDNGGNGSGGSGGGSDSGTGDSGTGDSGNGDNSNNNSDTTIERGILSVKTSSLSYTADSSGNWWMNLWITGSNLSDNISHYKFHARDKDGKIQNIPNEYFRVQHVDAYGGYGYFTQRQVSGGQHNDLFKWMVDQFNKKNYGAIIVEPARENIKPTNVQQKPSNNENQQQAKINTFKLQKTYGIAEYERAIVVNGQNLPSDWSKYELKWKQTDTNIPSSLFRDSIYNVGNYQVFVLKRTAAKEFVDQFDKLLSNQSTVSDFFELTLKSNSSK